MNIKNKRFLTLGLTTVLSSAVVAGIVLSIVHVKGEKDSSSTNKNNENVFLGNENDNKILDANQEPQNLALKSIRDISIRDFSSIYSDHDKLKVSTHEENNKTHEIIKLIKSNIKGNHHLEAKNLIDDNIVSLEPQKGFMKIIIRRDKLKKDVPELNIFV